MMVHPSIQQRSGGLCIRLPPKGSGWVRERTSFMLASGPCLVWRGTAPEALGPAQLHRAWQGTCCSCQPTRWPLMLSGSPGSGRWAVGSSNPFLSLSLDHPWELCFAVPSPGCRLELRSGLERFPPQCVSQNPALCLLSNLMSCLVPACKATEKDGLTPPQAAPHGEMGPLAHSVSQSQLEPTSALNSGDMDSFIPSLCFF